MGYPIKYLPPHKQKYALKFIRIPLILAFIAAASIFFLDIGIGIPVKIFFAVTVFGLMLIIPTGLYLKNHYLVIEVEIHENKLTVLDKKNDHVTRISPNDIQYYYITDRKGDILVKMNDPEKDLFIYNSQLTSTNKGVKFKSKLKDWLKKHNIQRK